MEFYMKNKFAPLLVSSLLCTTTVLASNIKLSDVYNGLISEDIKQDDAKLKQLQDTVVAQFISKKEDLMIMQDQIERFYGPVSRKGDKIKRKIANAVCDINERRINKIEFLAQFYEGHKGDKAQLEAALQSTQGMQDQPPKMGQHAAIKRQIEAITLELEESKLKLANLPSQKQEWESEIKEKGELIEKLQGHLEKKGKKRKQKV